MPIVPFTALPDHGRLWVFPVSRTLSSEERDRLLADVDAFLVTWSAHGAPLHASRELVEDRFLVIAVDVDAEAPSGCSIDALVHRLQGLAEELDVSIGEHDPVLYRVGETIRSASRSAFRGLAQEGEVAPDVAVFDTTLTRVDQYRTGGLERPATQSWHGRAFFRDLVDQT